MKRNFSIVLPGMVVSVGARRLKGIQRSWVKRELLAGKTLTHPDLISACGGRGGWRLGAVIHKLRGEGWPVKSVPIVGGCEANPPVRYPVPAGWQPGGSVQMELL